MKDIKIKGIFVLFDYIKWWAYIIPLTLIPLIFIHIFQKRIPLREGYLTRTSQKFSSIGVGCYLIIIILLLILVCFGILE